MSVWKSGSYKDDAFQFFARNLPPAAHADGTTLKTLDFETAFVGQLNDKIRLSKPNVAENFVDAPYLVAGLASTFVPRASVSLHETLKGCGKIKHGIEAVYGVIKEAWNNIWTLRETDDATLEAELFTFGLTGAYHSKNDVHFRLPTVKDRFRRDFLPAKAFVKDLHITAAAHKRKGYFADLKFAEAAGKALPVVEAPLRKYLPGYEFFTYRGTIIAKSIGTKDAYFLMQKDVDRIEKFIVGCGTARVYGYLYGTQTEEVVQRMSTAIRKWQDLAVSLFGKENSGRHGSICRAFDIAYYIKLAEYATDIDDVPLELQKAKYGDGGYDKIVAWHRIHAVTSGLAMKETLEVLQQYKMFPPNDFDSYSHADRQEKMYAKYRKVHAGVEDKEHFKGIIAYYRWLMVVAFKHRHGYCPGHVTTGDGGWRDTYPHCEPSAIPFAETWDIDFAGSFIYNTRGGDCIDLVKDKAVCPKRIRGVKNMAEYGKLKVWEKSQLVDVLVREELPNLESLKDQFGQLDLDVKADDKFEAKKEEGRWFMEAGTELRLLFSEYEDSNADYARHMPGAVVGKDSNQVKEMINAASAPAMPGVGTKPLFVSFDIEKFSPALNPEVNKAVDALWAEAYGVPVIKEFHRISTEGSIHYVKAGFHHHFKKTGADFEGFWGRKHTMYHCAVMGYTINKLRKEGLTSRGAHFATLIDDGLLRLMVPEDIDQKGVTVIKDRIAEIYMHASMLISWDKTFVSFRMAMFLNEVRMYGRSITPGMKTIVRINDMADEICPNVVADVAQVAGMVRGAITAGASPCAAYAVYALFVGSALKRWGKLEKKVHTRGVLQMFLPVRLGGVSACGLLALCGSLTHDDLSETLGLYRAVGFRYPNMRKTIDGLIDIDVREVDDDREYTAPTKVVASGKTLNPERGKNRIKRFLLASSNLPAIAGYLQLVREGKKGQEVRLPKVPPRFPVECRERMWASTVYHVVEGLVSKFLRAKSALCIVPLKVLLRSTIANKVEARSLLRVWLV